MKYFSPCINKRLIWVRQSSTFVVVVVDVVRLIIYAGKTFAASNSRYTLVYSFSSVIQSDTHPTMNLFPGIIYVQQQL